MLIGVLKEACKEIDIRRHIGTMQAFFVASESWQRRRRSASEEYQEGGCNAMIAS
jgi:hypothetical protein